MHIWKKISLLIAIAITVLAIMMVDVVHLEGDHVSYLVVAPFPTPGFVYGGGEQGACQRNHPGQPAPWWLNGNYMMLSEVTGWL